MASDTLSTYHSDSVNVTYVILPTEFYLGQTNLITVRSRQSNTRLHISMNITELTNLIENDDITYNLVQLNSTDNWYGLDIPYEIPFIFTHDDTLWVKLIFNFTHCLNNSQVINSNYSDLCDNFKHTEVIHSIQLKQPSIIIIGETDKPIYRPNEIVHFRFLTINLNSLSTQSSSKPLPKQKLLLKKGLKGELKQMNIGELVKWENIIYDEIIITDPMDNRVKQWLNITPDKIIHLQYKILNNAKEGRWKLQATVRQYYKEIIEFTVKKYTLPKFTVDLATPQQFTVKSEYVQYSICAKYTNGPPLKGYAKTILCVCNEYIWDNHFNKLDDEKILDIMLSNPKCPHDNYETNSRPCIITNQILGIDGCTIFNISTNNFALSTNKYTKWNQKSMLCSVVEEDSTNSKLYHCLKGDEIQVNQPSLKLELPSVYKSKLPINGKVKLINIGDTTNYSIKISVSDQKWGCYWRDSGDTGIEHYLNILPINSSNEIIIHIPPIQSQHSISIEAELIQFASILPSMNSSLDKEKNVDDINSFQQLHNSKSSNYMYWSQKSWSNNERIIDSVILRSWDSVSKHYLQLWPPIDTIVTTCPNIVKLTLLSNLRLSDKTIFIESVIRGKHQTIIISPSITNDDNCIDRDDELGHYKCLHINSSAIECLPGWSGENCLVPVCSIECSKRGGFCSKPNQCQCKSGWTGQRCDQCIKRENCLHGNCLLGNDCVCTSGWTGYVCDTKKVVHETFEDDSETNHTESKDKENNYENDDLDKLTTTQSPLPMNTTPIRTLYQRNIEFSIDGSWGPQFTAILYIHHQLDDMSPEIISTQLTIEKIDNCSSNAIAIQSKSNRTNLKFSQTIADPGEKVKLIILPEGISSLDEKLDDSHQPNNSIQLNDNKVNY
ncbi:Delta-like protein [Schistosoma japonicum]|uniref:Delta-like protein n=1 Tax=Schistosoma japonicum TaxID=6182 RepID=A0A4Z2DSX3_SCHJA|nr:Delta-like protein [Schistosoma japonicum]